MTFSTTPRLVLPQWSNGAVDGPTRAEFNAAFAALEAHGVGFLTPGLFSALPAASAANAGMFYAPTDKTFLLWSTGSTWHQIVSTDGAQTISDAILTFDGTGPQQINGDGTGNLLLGPLGGDRITIDDSGNVTITAALSLPQTVVTTPYTVTPKDKTITCNAVARILFDHTSRRVRTKRTILNLASAACNLVADSSAGGPTFVNCTDPTTIILGPGECIEFFDDGTDFFVLHTTSAKSNEASSTATVTVNGGTGTGTFHYHSDGKYVDIQIFASPGASVTTYTITGLPVSTAAASSALSVSIGTTGLAGGAAVARVAGSTITVTCTTATTSGATITGRYEIL